MQSILERFLDKVEFSDEIDCWIWKGAKTGKGYGNFILKGTKPKKWIMAHRFSYEQFIGPIPNGLQLDHLCRNRACVNPMHLEPVTNKENSQRGLRGRMVTHCVNGHEYTEENTYIRSNGRRRCKICKSASEKKSRKKR